MKLKLKPKNLGWRCPQNWSWGFKWISRDEIDSKSRGLLRISSSYQSRSKVCHHPPSQEAVGIPVWWLLQQRESGCHSLCRWSRVIIHLFPWSWQLWCPLLHWRFWVGPDWGFGWGYAHSLCPWVRAAPSSSVGNKYQWGNQWLKSLWRNNIVLLLKINYEQLLYLLWILNIWLCKEGNWVFWPINSIHVQTLVLTQAWNETFHKFKSLTSTFGVHYP